MAKVIGIQEKTRRRRRRRSVNDFTLSVKPVLPQSLSTTVKSTLQPTELTTEEVSTEIACHVNSHGGEI